MQQWISRRFESVVFRRFAPSGARACGRSLWLAAAFLASSFLTGPAAAFTLAFEAADFGLTPTFSNVRTFVFSIEIDGPLVSGSYVDPLLVGVDYQVAGVLADTPSGFPAFDLVREIAGPEFYAQGSSLDFTIADTADLSDGLQVSELVGGAGVFVFNGREVGTGRYHPALFELNSDGTGLIRNSNNMGGINPSSMEEVDVEIGEEYVTALTFDPATLTLAVPEPSTGLLVGLGMALLAARRSSRPADR